MTDLRQAVLALAEELEGEANRCTDVVARIALRDAGHRLDAALAADPEPREDVVERMARAMAGVTIGFGTWAQTVTLDDGRRLAGVALDATTTREEQR